MSLAEQLFSMQDSTLSTKAVLEQRHCSLLALQLPHLVIVNDSDKISIVRVIKALVLTSLARLKSNCNKSLLHEVQLDDMAHGKLKVAFQRLSSVDQMLSTWLIQ